MHWEAVLFPLAALLYTAAIGAERRGKGLTFAIVSTFAIALTLDTGATLLVCAMKPHAWDVSFHMLMGLLALCVMGVHFLWALTALKRQGVALVRFHYWAPWAWSVWMISFISGIPH